MLKSETLAIDGKSFNLTHGYNSAGHPSSLTYPPGRTLALAPNGLGQPTQLGVYASNIAYSPNGQPASLTYGNGIHASFATNTRNQRSHTVYSLFGTELTNRTLTYDKNANLTSISDSASGNASCATSDTVFCDGFDGSSGTLPLAGTDARTFTYDILDRLTKIASSRYGNDSYTYDPLGNVRTASYNGTSFHYDAATNRLSTTTDSGTTVYGYDTRGNVTSVGGFALNWNRANELTSDGFGTTDAYDARGWRVKKVVNASHSSDATAHTRYFIYDSAHHLMERWDNGTVTDFVTLGSKPIARIEANTPTYIQDDYQHSPLFETSSAGQVTRAPDYLGYGRTDVEGQKEIPGYTGAAPDKETGLLYLGARYLFHTRFTSPDPAGLNPMSPMGLNRYAYGNDNPVRFTDPFGRCTDSNSSCGIMVRSVAADELANPNRPLTPVGRVITAIGVAAVTASGLGDVVALAKGIATVDKAMSDSTTPLTTLQKNMAQGKAGEALTRAKYGDQISGEQVTIKTFDGTRTRTDFVTKDRGIIETKTGGAKLSKGQTKLFNDISAGRKVTPVGKNATNAGLESGQSTVLESCTIVRC